MHKIKIVVNEENLEEIAIPNSFTPELAEHSEDDLAVAESTISNENKLDNAGAH